MRASLRRLGIEADNAIVIAVSGGADSTSLLDALVRLRNRDGRPQEIFVAHLNHQLRGEESDEDEKFVRGLAAQLNLVCSVEKIGVAEEARAQKQNLEATARLLRYDFLRRVAQIHNIDLVFTAHTRDDQVETILMRLLRGSGPVGLRGIHEVRQLTEKVKLIRPMLNITRHEVIAHCEHYGLAFRTDTSNQLTDLTRNRIRHDLLPLLLTFNPLFNEALLRTAELMTEDEDYLQQLSKGLVAKGDNSFELDIKPLHEIHPAIRRRVLRLWLRDARGGLLRIDREHINALEDLIRRNHSGQSIDLPGWSVRLEFDRMILFRKYEVISKPIETINLNQEKKLDFGRFRFLLQRNVPRERLGQGESGRTNHFVAVLRECNELNGLLLRTRVPGDSYVPAGRRHTIKLKTLMIRHKIPLSQRNSYPVLVTRDNQIVWAPGLPVAKQFATDKHDEQTGRCALIIAEKLGLE
ncbi:MAG: tRNA lysidine(34) synthetase TilS [Acidobacteria bacterium]|nr:tRNA lysidine(34) synthetase TilS [Acidobacteriota bacterium]